MGVIVELSIPADTFQLGRILTMENDTTITLDTMVPLGNKAVPFVRVHGSARDSFEASVRDRSSVSEVHVVTTHDDEVLYALDWEPTDETFLKQIKQLDGHILEATGSAEQWNFQLRFNTHNALSTFQQNCFEEDIPLNVIRIYNPTKPDAGPFYGLTNPQRDTLMMAVENGYYSLPRRASTEDLAEEFDVTAQAITERLRRAIETLVANTLLLTPEDDD